MEKKGKSEMHGPLHEILHELHNPKTKWVLILITALYVVIELYNHLDTSKRQALIYEVNDLKGEIEEKQKIQKNLNTAIKVVRREFDNTQDLCKGNIFIGNLVNYKRTRREIVYDLIDADEYTRRVFGDSVADKTADFIKASEAWQLCSGEASLYKFRLQQRAITAEMDNIIRNDQKELQLIKRKAGIMH